MLYFKWERVKAVVAGVKVRFSDCFKVFSGFVLETCNLIALGDSVPEEAIYLGLKTYKHLIRRSPSSLVFSQPVLELSLCPTLKEER